jgi:hypothetical protein
MPIEVYLESLLRHVLDIRTILDGYPARDPATGDPITLERALCAARFNLSGMMHEIAVEQLVMAQDAELAAERNALEQKPRKPIRIGGRR